jgi:hypothetical protein
MDRVYVSSTVKDLEAERKAVFDWLVEANHQPVHSYRPDSETVRDSCLADIDGCDLYVLISATVTDFSRETAILTIYRLRIWNTVAPKASLVSHYCGPTFPI